MGIRIEKHILREEQKRKVLDELLRLNAGLPLAFLEFNGEGGEKE